MNKKESEFNKVFSAWDILVIAFGAMIGWGWVVSTGNWIEKGGVLGAALGFCLGGVMIFFVGLTYAELTAAMPQCGGEHVFPQAAEEINVPPKKIGKMLILSVILAVVFYALVIIAVGLVLDSGAIIKSQEATGLVTADAMGTAFGMKIMAKVVIVGGMCGIITSWNSFLIGGSRAMYSMAESYMIPKTFAKLHPKHKTPINALILIGVLTMLAPFAGRQLLVWISDAGNFACCLAYCMVAVSFMILRKKEPDMPRPYKVPAYKFFGTMAVIMSGFMVCMYCIPGSGGSLILPEWGMVGAWSLLGVVFYVVCKRKYKESFGDLVELISDEDAATLMPEADDEELDKVIDAAIDRVLASI